MNRGVGVGVGYTYGIPSLCSNCHLPHAFFGIIKIANIQIARWIVVITQLNRTGIEIQVRRGNGLLPCLQRGHRVVAEFIREAADRVGGEIECE